MAISDEAGNEVEAAMAALNEMQLKFDARALAAVCLSKASFLYLNLRRMGYETPESLKKLYDYGLELAMDDNGPPAKVQLESGHIVDPSRKN